MPFNILQLAEANASSLKRRFEELMSQRANDDVHLRRFGSRVSQESLVAVNIRPRPLARVVEGGKYLNIYEWAEQESTQTGQSVDHLLRQKLGAFFSRRIVFDGAFENGRQFRYGALNMGSAGVTRFGLFCVVLSSRFADDGRAVAYLPNDSLSAYADASGVVD